MLLLLAGQEWIVILIAVVILLIWGPSKLPALARGIGEALREFRRASSGMEDRREEHRREEEDRKILEMARSLGISTEGKTRDQLLDEINRKLAELRGR